MRGERERLTYLCESVRLPKVFGRYVSIYSETFFTNSAVVATSLVRSHVVFKLLNYVTDKIVRVALITSALMLTCVQTVCEGERESGSLVQIHTFLAKSYGFYELPIRMNLYEWPTPNPAPKPTRHWGLDKSY